MQNFWKAALIIKRKTISFLSCKAHLPQVGKQQAVHCRKQCALTINHLFLKKATLYKFAILWFLSPCVFTIPLPDSARHLAAAPCPATSSRPKSRPAGGWPRNAPAGAVPPAAREPRVRHVPGQRQRKEKQGAFKSAPDGTRAPICRGASNRSTGPSSSAPQPSSSPPPCTALLFFSARRRGGGCISDKPASHCLAGEKGKSEE